MRTGGNVRPDVVDGFGDEWSRFDQSELSDDDRRAMFDAYFRIFPWDALPRDAVGFDLGCGSGRWATLVAPRVGELHCLDPSPEALEVAQRNLVRHDNCKFHVAGVDEIPLEDGSADFGYALGVLHHIPKTQEGLDRCVAKLRPGAPFLVYLYYAFDNRPLWFRRLWRLSEIGRRVLSSSPHTVRYVLSQLIALIVYLPLARTARTLERRGRDVDAFPLSYYRDRRFYVMRTDALDRFGTRLEQRFTRTQIEGMMQRAGLEGIRFSDDQPYWCAVGTKRATTT